jgi:rRNA maturation endonuclease Nob1
MTRSHRYRIPCANCGDLFRQARPTDTVCPACVMQTEAGPPDGIREREALC